MPIFCANRFGMGDQIVGILFMLSILTDLLLHLVISMLTFMAFIAFFFATWLGYLFCSAQHWTRSCIPCPAANLFMGHTLLISEHKNSGGTSIEKERKLFKEHGNTFGLYIHGRPAFYTLDPEMLKRFFITDFAFFRNRFFTPFVDHNFGHSAAITEGNILRNILHVKKGEDWRRARNCISPAFSTGKLKKHIPTFCDVSNQFCDHLDTDFVAKGKELPLKDLFFRLVLAQNARACLSLDLMSTFTNETSAETLAFIHHIRHYSTTALKGPLLRLLAISPFIVHQLEAIGFDILKNPSIEFFRVFLGDLYEERRGDPHSNEKFHDIFQCLVKAHQQQQGKECGHSNSKKEELSKMELLSNAFILLVGGLETTASVLQFAVYMLAIRPDYQQRVRQEVFNILGQKQQNPPNEINYEQLSRMHFLQAFIKEILRMFPPAPTRHHECSADMMLNGIHFCKGNIIALPMYAIQHSELFYEEPESFKPERFMQEENGFAEHRSIRFIAFGVGPRACVGRRFAELQIQTVLALLVARFNFKPAPKTPPFPLEFLSTANLLCPKHPLIVLAEKCEE